MATDPLTTDPSPSGEGPAATGAEAGAGPPDGTSPDAGAIEAKGEDGHAAPSFKVMELYDVTVELPANHAVAKLLETEAPSRLLDIPIGMTDATALAYALRGMKTPRPLTHELFSEVLGRLRADLVAVRLTGRQGGTYLAELDLMAARGREVVGCRPSDGLNLALRQPVPAPVLADERLLEGPGDVEPG